MGDVLGIIPPAPDAIDAAVSAAERPTVEMLQLNVTISSTGRPAMLALPADATDGELAELAGWMLTAVLGKLRADRTKTAGGRILVPRR